ncbi:NADH dehydrogenase [ubiquinone] 1 alpha subcomplex subunit 10 [Anaeramoeba flamelloides]|uniref:NADH dehydrogenase [ubiquinone] 1 alpha subcomplex subunit 10 n=1 Tax=Anaeramoeba flamelloides TaxID=1746091 RepID=A0ABQ8XS38_9EUKA|nr:NADH dehydrogenase [ubiquinone] 1 alpha subcomplex subunit 10 [Anaeramoeba flamelloides]
MSFIIIEGNISAGKTTLCRELGRLLDYEVFYEPTAKNPYLELYYADPKKWGLPMQLYLLRQRFMTYLHCLERLESGKIKGVILDRSIYSDWVFAKKNFNDKNIDEEGYKLYSSIRKEMLNIVPYPQICLYLSVKPKICYDRIHKLRGRKCESSIPLEYLSGLNECYESLNTELQESKTHVARINWNNFGYASEVLNQIIFQICPNLKKQASNSKKFEDIFLFDPEELSNYWDNVCNKLGDIFNFPRYSEYQKMINNNDKLREVMRLSQQENLSSYLVTDQEEDVLKESTTIPSSEIEETSDNETEENGMNTTIDTRLNSNWEKFENSTQTLNQPMKRKPNTTILNINNQINQNKSPKKARKISLSQNNEIY